MGRLFLWGSSGYLLGNLLVNTERHIFFSWCLLLGAGVVVAVVLSSWRSLFPLGLAFAFLWLGFVRVTYEADRWDNLPEAQRSVITGVITQRDAPTPWAQPLVVQPIETDTLATNILWRAPRTTTLTPGTLIQLDCSLHRPENFSAIFDYRRYLATKEIGYLCEGEHAAVVLPGSSRWRATLFVWQGALREKIYSFLSDPAAGLLQGLFLGGDDSLSIGLREAFRRAGLSHIIAVSGYNMTLVAMAVLFLALFAGLWRKTATVFAMTGILVFLLLIDTSAASLRAALMAWIGFAAFFLGRPLQIFNSLFFAALLMAIIHPLIVRYDIGFQLSFLATLMLFLASPWLEQLVRRGHWYTSWAALFLSTIAIEVGIFPVIAFHFGMVSLLTPLANMVVLPLVPMAMLFGFLTLFLGSLFPFLGVLMAFPTWLTLMLIIWVSEWIGSFPWGVVQSMTFPVPLLCVWYIVLGGVVWYSRKLLQRYVLRLDH